MPKKVKIDDLSSTILDYMENYNEDIRKQVRKVLNKDSKEALNKVVYYSPDSGSIRKNKYKWGWEIKTEGNTKDVISKKIWNKTNYRLTHLLEFGHVTKKGDRVPAQPHIREVESEYKVKVVKDIEKAIGGIK